MKKILLLAVTCSVFLASSTKVQACDCAPPEAEVLFEEAGLIFSGTVIRVDPLADPSRPAINTFEVSKVWKGDADETVQVYSVVDDCDSTSFELGKEYLVYTDGEDHLTRFFCGPTQILANAQEEVQELNSLNLNWKEAVLKIMVGVLGLLVVLSFYFWKKRPNKS
jgi:hypothetical protein